MILLRKFSTIIFILYSASPAFTQEGKVIVVDTASKELKRTAHRLRIPAEQLRNARQTLQEATDLARKMDPRPYEQFRNLAQNWVQLNRPKAKSAIESLIQDLHSEAGNPSNPQSYQRVTSAAMMLISSLADLDQERMLQLIRNWPNPPESLGDRAQDFRKNMETQAEKQALMQLAGSNPEKALEQLSQSSAPGTYDYVPRAQIAQGLMNAGKKDEALKLVDQTVRDFAQHALDPRASQEYEGFVRMTLMMLDSNRASAVLNQWITPVMNQAPSDECKGTLKVGDQSVDLTCIESRVLNLVRSFPMRPGLTLKTLNSVPGLQSKLDSVGGIDSLFSSGASGATPVQLTFKSPLGGGSSLLGSTPDRASFDNRAQLLQELRGKAESNPAFVKGKLRNVAKGPEDIDRLINLAMMAAYQDPELGSITLELAQELLSQVEPLQMRSTALQRIVMAYRQVEGEVDQRLLSDGFVLADQLRHDRDPKKPDQPSSAPVPPAAMVSMGQSRTSLADQLEVFLVAELARDNFASAIRYVRSMPADTLKLASLIQIVQSLRQANF